MHEMNRARGLDLTAPRVYIKTPAEALRQAYVCGFLFMPNRQNGGTDVVLIRKNKPDWQAGKLNGVGGKIEEGEMPYDAMVREFEEETGLPTSGWRQFLVMWFPKAIIFFHYLKSPVQVGVQPTTDEAVEVWNVTSLIHYQNKIPNLNWLIPMALHDSDYKPSPTLKYATT